ncbi:MAG: aminoglycoside 3'-phosphotransferase [Clostridia bacterium]|nr:aminoglycoside 3'-phosphotransferase [Clostridia bacterium]
MNRTPITVNPEDYPIEYRSLLGSEVYNSSCSPAAQVLFIDKVGGVFIKRAAAGSLCREATMTRYFHKLGLAVPVLDYRTEGAQDYLVTVRAEGEDCTHPMHLAQPERLCDLLATTLRTLHDTPAPDCPIPNHTALYLQTAKTNAEAGMFDATCLLNDRLRDTVRSAADAYAIAARDGKNLTQDALLHGDYCLPNVMLSDWHLSALIDLDHAGMGDRHVDLYWGAWTLCYNLGHDQLRERFFDAYGRDLIDLDKIELISIIETLG